MYLASSHREKLYLEARADIKKNQTDLRDARLVRGQIVRGVLSSTKARRKRETARGQHEKTLTDAGIAGDIKTRQLRHKTELPPLAGS